MMSPAEIDRLIAYGIFAFIAGGICWLLGMAVSTVMLVGLGAMSGAFEDWRTEHGLWMLGTLFLLIFGGFYAIITYHQIADWLVGRAPLQGWAAIDWLIATSTLAHKIRFLLSVSYWNRRLSSEA